MNMFPGRHLLVLAALTQIIPVLQPANLHAQTARLDTKSPPSPPRTSARETEKETMNAWTVGLAGGLLEGAPLRLAAEVAPRVDGREKLQALRHAALGP